MSKASRKDLIDKLLMDLESVAEDEKKLNIEGIEIEQSEFTHGKFHIIINEGLDELSGCLRRVIRNGRIEYYGTVFEQNEFKDI